MNKILEIKNLTKYYGNILGIKDISLNLCKGEILGFIGPNGAGKSTTIRTIMNILNRTSGEIIFYDNKEITIDEIKEKIGYLPSEINLYGNLKVKEMLDYNISLYKKTSIEKMQNRKNELVAYLELDENKYVSDLSLGNLKKLGIVMCLMHDPEIIILDEATSGLDPLMQEKFFKLLKDLKNQNKAIIYSTHVLREVEKICDKVAIIKQGHLIELKPTSELEKTNLKSHHNVIVKTKDLKMLKEELSKNNPFVKIDIIDDEQMKFSTNIKINDLIKILTKYDIEKLNIYETTIEEIFMNYYE